MHAISVVCKRLLEATKQSLEKSLSRLTVLPNSVAAPPSDVGSGLPDPGAAMRSQESQSSQETQEEMRLFPRL